MPKDQFNTPIQVTAYWTTQDGTIVKGESTEKRVYQGIETIASPEQLGFTTRLTIEDFNIEGGIYKPVQQTGGTYTDCNMSGSYSGSLDGTYLDVDIALPDAGANATRLSYATTQGNSWYGVRVYVENGYLCILGNANAKFRLSDYGVAAGEIFNLRLGVKNIQTADNTDSCVVGVWINRMYAGCQTYANQTTNVKLGTYLYATAAKDSDRIIIRKPQ